MLSEAEISPVSTTPLVSVTEFPSSDKMPAMSARTVLGAYTAATCRSSVSSSVTVSPTE